MRETAIGRSQLPSAASSGGTRKRAGEPKAPVAEVLLLAHVATPQGAHGGADAADGALVTLALARLALSYVELALVELTSALTQVVVSVSKQLLMIVMAMGIFGDPLSAAFTAASAAAAAPSVYDTTERTRDSDTALARTKIAYYPTRTQPGCRNNRFRP